MSDEEIYTVKSQLQALEVRGEERWKTTLNRLSDIETQLLRIEQRMLQYTGGVLIFLAGLITAIVTNYLN
tara:strand:+ start:101 stop:310 length:210 start_codon:yes stop_codon:yes gene_type:complete